MAFVKLHRQKLFETIESLDLFLVKTLLSRPDDFGLDWDYRDKDGRSVYAHAINIGVSRKLTFKAFKLWVIKYRTIVSKTKKKKVLTTCPPPLPLEQTKLHKIRYTGSSDPGLKRKTISPKLFIQEIQCSVKFVFKEFSLFCTVLWPFSDHWSEARDVFVQKFE